MSCALRRGCTNPPGAGECVVCPYAYACPRCRAGEGSPCRRPSEHECAIHVGRVEVADRVALARADVQLDIDGGTHEVTHEAPDQAHEVQRLFTPEGPQLRGQTALTINDHDERNNA